MKTKFIIGIIIIIIFGAWGVSAFLNTTIKYVSYDEARQATRPVQIVGKIDFNDVKRDTENNRLVFSIYEPEAENPVKADRMKIIYEGVVPGNFDQAESVMIVGMPGAEGFIADKLYVKCPSKYQGQLEKMESQG